MALIFWLRSRYTGVTWYKWPIGWALTIIGLIILIAHSFPLGGIVTDGTVISAALVALVFWLRSRDTRVTWLKRIIGCVWTIIGLIVLIEPFFWYEGSERIVIIVTVPFGLMLTFSGVFILWLTSKQS